MKRFYIFLPIYLGFFVILGVYEVIHPPFSTDSANIGDYQIKIETTPSVPETGKETVLHFIVQDKNGEPVDKFRMGVKIYYNDNLQYSVPIDYHNNGRWDLNYRFEESGNHVISIDFFDLKRAELFTHAFNVGVLNFYMNLFTYLVIAGLAGAGGILVAIMLYQKRSKIKKR